MIINNIKDRKLGNVSEEEWSLVLAQIHDNKTLSDEMLEMIKETMAGLIKRGIVSFRPEAYLDSTRKILTEILIDISDDMLYSIPPHGESFYNGEKRAIVKPEESNHFTEKFHYLISGKWAYGLLRFNRGEKVSLSGFKQRQSEHKISDAERKMWWPHTKDFYIYSVRDFFRFTKPVEIRTPKSTQNFLDIFEKHMGSTNSKFTCEFEKAMSCSIKETSDSILELIDDVENISKTELYLCHAKVHEHIEYYLHKGLLPTDIVNKHILIKTEMNRRGMEHIAKTIMDHASENVLDKPYDIFVNKAHIFDKIVPKEFFAIQKNNITHSESDFSNFKTFSEKGTGTTACLCVLEENIDGLSIEIHHPSRYEVFLFLEDGSLLDNNQFPQLVDDIHGSSCFIGLAKLDALIPKDMAIKAGLVSEKRKDYDGNVHFGENDIAKYIKDKEYNALISRNIKLNVYDVLWTPENKELFKKSLTKRIDVRENEIKMSGRLVSVCSEMSNSIKSVVDFWDKKAKLLNTKGITLKPAVDRYVLWNNGAKWEAFETFSKISCQALKVTQVTTNKWSVFCGVTVDDSIAYVGTVSYDKNDINVGDIINVGFNGISKYKDFDTEDIWFELDNPRIISVTSQDKQQLSDSIETVDNLFMEIGRKVERKLLSKDAREAIGKFYFSDLALDDIVEYTSDIFMKQHLEPEDIVEVDNEPLMPDSFEDDIKKAQRYSRKKLSNEDVESLPKDFYIIQSHWNGNSFHLDFRQEQDGNVECDSWSVQSKNIAKAPVSTIKEASEWSKKFHGPNASKYLKIHNKMDFSKGWFVEKKEPQSNDVLNAVKSSNSVFFGEDWGLSITTVKKPWFEERYLYSKWFGTVKYIKILLPKSSKNIKDGEKEVFWRAYFSNPKSPPYIFSQSFFKNNKWVPEGSALPPNWEAIVPEKLIWWDKGLVSKYRLQLIKATFNYLIEEKYLKGTKKVLDKNDFMSVLSIKECRWVLQRISWRESVHAKYIKFNTWRLRLWTDEKLLTYEFERDPSIEIEEEFTALHYISSEKPPKSKSPEDWLTFKGVLPINHSENPSKNTEANVSIVDCGNKFNRTVNSEDFMAGQFDGKLLKKYFTFKLKESTTNVWLFKQEKQGGC